jgi:hypothetical protein
VAICAVVLVLRRVWPFAEASVRSRLEQATSAKVSFGNFHEKYFPFGCVAENVLLQRNDDSHTSLSIKRLSIKSNPFAMSRHRVSELRVEGAQLKMDRLSNSMVQSKSSDTTIDNFVANDATVQVGEASSRPFRIVFQSLRLQHLSGRTPVQFSAVFSNPMPAGVVKIAGRFGSWSSSDPAATSVSGRYTLENADLGVFHSIAGKISSTGDFAGNFKALNVEGSASSPEFELTDTHHQLPLQAHFSVRIDTTSGDLIIPLVKAQFGRDQIDVRGTVARGKDGKRVALFDLNCQRGRIEDTFYPFVKSPKSPLTGDTAFQMHVTIPASSERFLKRVELKSEFQISNAKFTNPQTKFRLSKVSTPKQEDPAATTANMDGRVLLQRGTARFSELLVKDPGAAAQLHGTYNVIDDRVNLHGQLTTSASLAKATSGIKSVFARVLQPLLKKRHHEKIVPVKITGSFHHPSFGLDTSSAL